MLAARHARTMYRVIVLLVRDTRSIEKWQPFSGTTKQKYYTFVFVVDSSERNQLEIGFKTHRSTSTIKRLSRVIKIADTQCDSLIPIYWSVLLVWYIDTEKKTGYRVVSICLPMMWRVDNDSCSILISLRRRDDRKITHRSNRFSWFYFEIHKESNSTTRCT